MEIVKELATKLQIKLITKLVDAAADMLRLKLYIFFIIKADLIHLCALLFFWGIAGDTARPL